MVYVIKNPTTNKYIQSTYPFNTYTTELRKAKKYIIKKAAEKQRGQNEILVECNITEK